MAEYSKQKKVLFLCVGNSCRSQMAEALVNHYLVGQWIASSAGIVPTGYVHPSAIRVLAEVGIVHEGASKWVEQFIGQQFDRVITLCSEAEYNCPIWLGEGIKEHIGFFDPVQAQGDEEQKLTAFRNIRDDMMVRIIEHLKSL